MVRNMLSDSHVILSKYDHTFSKPYNYNLEEAIVAKSFVIEIYFKILSYSWGEKKVWEEKRNKLFFVILK